MLRRLGLRLPVAGITAGSGVIETHENDGSNNDNDNTAEAHSLSNRSVIGGAHVGYDWGLSQRWLLGVEGGYQYLGHSEALQHYPLTATLRSGTTIRALDALLTSHYYLSNRFNVFGKLGVAYEWLTRTSDCEAGVCNGSTIADSNHNQTTQYHFNPELQVGMGWDVSDVLRLSAAYQRVMGDDARQYNDQTSKDDTRINPTINGVLLGLDYQFTQVPDLSAVTRAPHGGGYAGITAGSSVIETHEKDGSNNDSDEAYSLSNRSVTGGAHVGYDWGLSQRWLLGVEGGYQYLGHSEALQHYPLTATLRSGTTIRALDALLTSHYYLSNRFNVFGKLGVAYEWLTRTSDCEAGVCNTGTIAVSNHNQTTQYHFNPELQVGMGWDVSDALHLSAAYQRVMGDDVRQYNDQTSQNDTHINPTINGVLLGLDYQFTQVPDLSAVTRAPHGGGYAGITAGSSVIETHEKDDGNNDNLRLHNLSNRSVVGGAHVGYDWGLSQRWLLGLEGGYQYLGHSQALQHNPLASTLRSGTTIRALDALLTSHYYLSNQFSLFGKLGVAYEWLTSTSDCEAGVCHGSTIAESNHNQTTQYHFNPELQVGMGWDASDTLRLSAAYQRVMGDDVRQSDTQTSAEDTRINPTINGVVMGVDYKF